MKRSLKATLLAGAVVAMLAGPVTPANASTCFGYVFDHGELQNAGAWNCDSGCPPLSYHGPLDGRWHLIVCV